MMPVLSGRAAYEQIREFAPNLQVIFMSGYAEDPRTSAPFTPKEPLVQKPFGRETLLDAVRRALSSEGGDAT